MNVTNYLYTLQLVRRFLFEFVIKLNNLSEPDKIDKAAL